MGAIVSAVDIHGRMSGTNFHIDLSNIAPPNLAIFIAAFCKEYTMHATLRRAECMSVGAVKFIEMHHDKLFICGAVQITQKAVANPYVLATTEAPRLLNRHASDDRIRSICWGETNDHPF